MIRVSKPFNLKIYCISSLNDLLIDFYGLKILRRPKILISDPFSLLEISVKDVFLDFS
jgi:hypothetical protein